MSNPGIDPWGVGETGTPAPAAQSDQGWLPNEGEAAEAIRGIVPGTQITSEQRTPEHNAAVGGVPDSMHVTGQAMDFVLPKGVTADQVKSQLVAQGYPVSEFINEGDHIHWGWRPKGSAGPAANDPWGTASSGGQDPWAPAQAAPAAQPAAASGKPESSWAQVLSPNMASAWDAMKNAGVGLAQWLYNQDPTQLSILGIPIPNTGNMTPEMQAKFAAYRAPFNQWANKARADIATDIKANTPNLDPGSAKSVVYQTLAGVTNMVPAIAIGMVTKSPEAAAAVIGAQAGGERYGQALQDGRTPAQASMDAQFDAMVNGTLGLLPMHALMAPGGSFLKKTLTNAGAFGVQSVATEALQIGYDKGIIGKDMTLKDAWSRLEQAGIVGTLSGALIGGGHAGLEAAAGRLHANIPTPEAPRQEPTAEISQTTPVPPTEPYTAGPVHADILASIGLKRPGVAPEADPWAPAGQTEPSPEERTYRASAGQIAAEHAAEISSLEAQGTIAATQRMVPLPSAEEPAALAPEAAQEATQGIPRRELEADTAVTPTGREVPVRYAVVEASHLVPSQTPEGHPNPNFPAELQPRDRSRAVSQAQVASIAQNINPRLLDRSVNASDGAPVIAQSGIVESGNGRTLALQRAYAERLPSADAYRDYLAKQGYPVEDMTAPVLVRVREGEMTPEDRQAFVREANQPSQLGYSATERAMSDASAIPDSVLETYRGGDVENAGNRDFVRGFMQRVIPANEHAGMVAPDGSLSQEAIRRVRGALLAKAYGDPDLVGSIVESQDSNTKAIGGAMTDAAADWAKMRGMAARGEISPALDQTAKLLEAVKLVAHARETGRNVAEFVSQPDIFTGEAIDPDTEAWLRLMFRNTKDWTQPVGRDKLAAALQFYAQEAQKARAEQFLIGAPLSGTDILQTAKARQYGERNSEAGPSLSFGQTLRSFGRRGAGPGAQEAAPGGSEGLAEGRSQATTTHLTPSAHVSEGKFGPRPYDADLGIEPRLGQPHDLSPELDKFVAGAGVDSKTQPVRALQAIANYVYMRGHKFTFEALGARGSDGRLYGNTDGRENAVSFHGGIMDALRDPSQRLITFHNHPSSMGFSAGDTASLAYPGHDAMVVVTHDGNFHTFRLKATFIDGDLDKQAGELSRLHREAHRIAIGWMDPLHASGEVNTDDADFMLSQIVHGILERAGIVEYMGSREAPAYLVDRMADIIKTGAEQVRRISRYGQTIEPGPAPDAYRLPRAISFREGMAELLGGARENAGQPGGAGREGPSARPFGKSTYKKPEQLRLLEGHLHEDEKRPEFKAWFGDSKIVDENGKPKIVYHGTPSARPIGEFKTPAYFTDTPSFAEMFAQERGEKRGAIYPVFLKIEHPYEIDATKEGRHFEWDAEDVARMKAEGYDGVVVKGGEDESDIYTPFDQSQIKSAIGNRGTFNPNDPNILREDEKRYEQKLVLHHNLSAENLIHADRMGGIAAPSAAITPHGRSISGYGEITMLGDRDMANPRYGAKVFGADVYSRRYPEITYKLDNGAIQKLDAALKSYRAPDERAHYATRLSVRDMRNIPGFEAYAKANFPSPQSSDYPDFDAAATHLLRQIGASEHLFRGFTPGGQRRYQPHTLDNVVRELRRNVRGGESFNYGVGSLRSHYTPEFRSVEAIKKNAGRLVTADQFEAMKNEIDGDFWHTAESLAPYYQYDSKRLGYGDTVIDVLADAKKMGLRAALRKYGFEDVPADKLQDVAAYLEKLRHLPTEYFEAKFPRAVGINEFKAAVVPHDLAPAAREALARHGVETHEYKRGDEADRQRAVAEAASQHGTLFEEERRYANEREATRPPFYSALTRSIEDSKLTRAAPKDWAGLIDNLRNKGVKQEEIDWSGVKDWLAKQTGPVTKDQVLQHLRENEVQVQEVEKGAPKPSAPGTFAVEHRASDGEWLVRDTRNNRIEGAYTDESAAREAAARNDGYTNEQTKYGSYTLPGGENYRELLLTMPHARGEIAAGNRAADYAKYLRGKYGERYISQAPKPELTEYNRLLGEQHARATTGKFQTAHFEERNVLAHVRFDDRTGPSGEKILHIAEVQSDWHQKGRREGYGIKSGLSDAEEGELNRLSARARDPQQSAALSNSELRRLRQLNDRLTNLAHEGVPNAPFKTSWHELALKRMLRYAAEHGYDKLTWDTGETQADRYDLSKQIKNLHVKPLTSGKFSLAADLHTGQLQHIGDFDAKGLPDAIGKEMAKTITDDFADGSKMAKTYSGLDLKVGGEGMKGFYDKIVPRFLAKYARRWGAKVEHEKVPTKTDVETYEGPEPTKEQILKVAEAIHARAPDQRFVSPITGERVRYQINRVANESSMRDVMKEMERGKTFTEAMADNGSHDLAEIFGGKKVVNPHTGTQPVHSIDITPAMRESVMQGQALFEEKSRYKEEPGAVDAQGRPLPQAIIPGAEATAAQLAKAREAAGHGLKTAKAKQQAPGGMFGPEGDLGQGSLFEDEKRYEALDPHDRNTLERAARTGNWIGKYRVGEQAGNPSARIRAAIARAFDSWRRVPATVPKSAADVFEKVLPQGFSDVPTVPTTRPGERFAAKVKGATEGALDLTHDFQTLATPMARGTKESRASGKDFANVMRVARDHGQSMIAQLDKKFTPAQLRDMWIRGDEESVARQEGKPTAGIGLSKLSPEERRAVLEQQTDAQNVWNAAKEVGMVSSNGLPSYVPRMFVEIASGGVKPLSSDRAARSIPGIGRNLRTSTAQMLGRKHLLTEESEAAAAKKTGKAALVVRDIRTLPLATMRLREAVAGRALINRIKEIGAKTGDETVVEGAVPHDPDRTWFHLNHPAFYTWRPKFIRDPESGEYVAQKDQKGDTVLEKTPLYVRGDFEGPLRAVLSGDNGKIYNALMDLKGRAMSTIMFSPLVQLHLLTEIGRAVPTFPMKVITTKIFFEGNAAKKDPLLRTEAVMHGLVPIGHQGAFQDISSIAQGGDIVPGRSWTAQLLGAVPGWLDPRAGDAVKRAVDRMGDLVHNGLLWDRVQDLQFGLYTNFRDHLVKKGFSPDAAQYMAAHFANRYAGTLPVEAMSSNARKIANLMLFSRTYTLGNLAVVKDIVTGLPRDVQAQIERDGSLEELKRAQSYTRRKTASVLALDVALKYAMTAALSGAFAYMLRDQSLSDIEKGYIERWKNLENLAARDPLAILNPFADLDALSQTANNEIDPATGKPLDRILVDYNKQGTAIYARNPLGKFADEYRNWVMAPGETAVSKLSPFVKPLWDTIANDRGYGRHVYEKTDSTAVALGKIAEHYVTAFLPMDQLNAARDMLMGKTKSLDATRLVGRALGVTFRQGAPGGPAVGALYALQREHEAKVSEAMPDIVQKIRDGDVAGARKDMRSLGMSPGLQNYYIRTTKNPMLKFNTRGNRELLRGATPQERARIEQLRGSRP
jgi:hypothetical protein